MNSIQVNDESENKDQKIEEKLKTLITKYGQIFSQHKYDVRIIKTEKCMNELNNHIPINLTPYRCSLKDQKILNEQIQNLLNHDLIRKSTSSYAFPITLVNKKDEGEKTRLCIDFRELNAVTITDSYPFPRIEDIIDQLYNCEVFSILNLNSEFGQVLNSRLFNWSYRLFIYDFDIKYIPGKDNVEADCLSRNPFHSNTAKINLLNLEEIQTVSKNLKVKNTINKNGLNKIYIPDSLINKLIEKAFYQYGDLGTRKLIDLISPYYTSENLHEHVSEVISRCVPAKKN